MNIGASAFHGLLTLLVVNTQSFAQLQTEHLAHVQHHPVGNLSALRPSFASIPPNSYQSLPVYLNIQSASKSGQYVAPSQQRNFYFPCSSRCAQPTQQIYRYRWVTTANSGPGRGVQQPPPQQPQPWLPPSSAVVQQPHNVRGAFVHLIFPQNSMVTAKTTTTTFATTTKIKNAPKTVTDTTKETTTSKRTSPSSPTTTTTTKSASKTIHPTLTTTHYALPTPPPYSPEQNIATAAGEVIVRLNPCPHGQPLVNEFRNPITCNFVVQPNGACPEDYWCHTGSSYETTTCCPVGHLRDRCQLPRANGEGDALIPRWYFDSGDRKCKRFLYTGMRGNANNFVTAMACMESCETAANAAIVRNPCANGPPARDLNGEQFVCGTSDSRCPAGYYCHLGDNPLTNVCCELSAAVSDRCHLALRTGEGAAHLRRFYLNTLTRRCVQFIYRGAKGNENHFNSLAECRRECERPPNPCPFVFDVGIRKECRNDGNDGGDRCGRGEWCHFGSSRETTACSSDDPCKLPLDLGQGAENLTRWYAIPAEDACQRECRPFQYKGMKGNQNNFRTKATCEANCKADCPLTLNPCADEEPLLDPEGRPQRCNGTGPQCPADYWCHIGANAETTVCCSGATRICSLPLAEGVGNALLSRWYFNAKDGGCHRFIYRGIGGNQNNYVDFEQCMNACPEDSPLPNSSPSPPPLPPPTANPCGIGTPLAESGGPKARECSPNSRCPTSHFCHIGGDPSTVPNVCCPKNGDPCEQPLAEGIGQFKLTRYHFDAPSRRCRAFVYRGARGNANNFLSAEDCELVCQVAPPASPIRANPCPQGSPLADDQNEPLVCGNSLAAADLSLFGPLTTAHQHQLQTGCPSGYWCHVGSSPDTTNCCPQLTDGGKRSCDLPLEYGIGGQRLDRWYFDGNSQACRHFLYTGLKGNANSFVSREQCQQACPELVNFGTEQQQNSLGFVTDHQPQQLSSFPSLATTKAITKVITKTMTTPTSAPLPSPCLRGELLRNEDGQAIKCHPDDEVGCPMDTHFCHIGHHLNESGCCPRTAGTNPCLLPVNRGLGTATHVRWHFSAGVRRCEAFDYAGQKGNENNFVTKRHCEERCMKSSMLPVQFCPHGEPKWERSARGNRKKPISCGPNDGCPEGYVCHVNSENGMALCCENPAHFCLQAREHGPCNAQEVRYGYNPLTDTCVQYRYGGCGGTLNQFDSIERCTQICCRQYRRN